MLTTATIGEQRGACPDLSGYRFLFLSLVLLCMIVLQTINGQWSGDFWEHSAAVRELTSRPFSPAHPQLAVRLPHASYSPYTLGIALVARLASLDPVTVLSIAGVFNLFLFLASFYVWVSLSLNRQGTPFYALLFLLLLWGDSPWAYSGFFHLGVLGYVLPYPSTFAASLAFIALSLYIALVRSRTRLWFIPISAIAAIVLVTHPLTFIVLCVGLISTSIGLRCLRFFDYLLLLGALAGSVLIALPWPYFPLARLIFSESSLYHPSNRPMYEHIVQRTFPALLGLPLILLRLKSNGRDPLAWMVLGLALVYGYGALWEKWSYGRVISYIVILLQIIIGDRVAEIECRLNRSQLVPKSAQDPRSEASWQPQIAGEPIRAKPQPPRQGLHLLNLGRLVYLPLVLGILLLLSFKGLIQPTLRLCLPGQPSTYGPYTFLADWTRQYDVVLTDLMTGWMVPTFGGKVGATLHPLAFVSDHERRRKDVRYFFSDVALHDARVEIAQRYRTDYLLLDKDRVGPWPSIAEAFGPLGEVVFSNEQFMLIDLHSLDQASVSQWLLAHPLKKAPQYVQVVRFGEPNGSTQEIELLGYDVDWDGMVDGERAQPGSEVRLVLYWHALRPIDADYTVFVHLLDPQDEIRGQGDGRPLEGRYPTDIWPTGVVVRDERPLTVATDAPPGTYRLAVGLYERATMERVSAYDEQGRRLDNDRAILGVEGTLG